MELITLENNLHVKIYHNACLSYVFKKQFTKGIYCFITHRKKSLVYMIQQSKFELNYASEI